MAHKKPQLIPYEHTLYDILIKNIKGKYFQNIISPHLVFQIPEENSLGIHYIKNKELSVWFPLLERHGDISLDDFVNYAVISEEQFKEYQKNKGDVLDYLLVPRHSKLFKDQNKPNLSEHTELKGFTEDYSNFGIPGDENQDNDPIY